MKNMDTVLYQLTETSEFMMSFVIVTRENNCIVIDDGAYSRIRRQKRRTNNK